MTLDATGPGTIQEWTHEYHMLGAGVYANGLATMTGLLRGHSLTLYTSGARTVS